MSGSQFLDTNVLVYSCDSSDAVKQQTALDLIAACSSQGTGVLSVQVLGEFFHATVVRKKLLTAAEAERAVLAHLEKLEADSLVTGDSTGKYVAA